MLCFSRTFTSNTSWPFSGVRPLLSYFSYRRTGPSWGVPAHCQQNYLVFQDYILQTMDSIPIIETKKELDSYISVCSRIRSVLPCKRSTIPFLSQTHMSLSRNFWRNARSQQEESLRTDWNHQQSHHSNNRYHYRKTFPQNYRIISLFSTIGKLVEIIIITWLNDALEEHQVFQDKQFSFRAGHSTALQLLRTKAISRRRFESILQGLAQWTYLQNVSSLNPHVAARRIHEAPDSLETRYRTWHIEVNLDKSVAVMLTNVNNNFGHVHWMLWSYFAQEPHLEKAHWRHQWSSKKCHNYTGSNHRETQLAAHWKLTSRSDCTKPSLDPSSHTQPFASTFQINRLQVT